MPKVLIVTNSLTGGGAERAMNLLCNQLFSMGIDVELLTVNSGNPDLILPMCETHSLNRRYDSGIFQFLATLIKFHLKVYKLSPDVLVLNCDLPELLGSLLLKHQKLIVVEHSNPAWVTRTKLGLIVRRALSHRKILWIVVSKHLKVWSLENEPYACIPNILISGPSLRPKLDSKSNLKRLVFIGRFEHVQKRPLLFVNIVKRVKMPALMIGGGKCFEEVRQFSDNHGLEIAFLGQIENPWVEITDGDLLIVPSAWEGDGLVVLEGLSKGVPILVSDNEHFRRFKFPEVNYCSSIEDFATRIQEYMHEIDLLRIPVEVVDVLLNERDTQVLGETWVRCISEFSKK